MALTVQITFDVADPRAQSRFWAAALGYVIPAPPGMTAEAGVDPYTLWDAFLERVGVPADQCNSKAAVEDPDGIGPRIFFQQVPEPKTVKNRVHLDLRAAAGLTGDARMAALEEESTRLVALGATRVRRIEADPPLEQGFIVMTDPEGNEFCLD